MRGLSVHFVTILIVLVACGGGSVVDQAVETPESAEKLVIYTVNYPLALFCGADRW